jgi:exosortase A-associated hydrolase 2
VRHGFFTNRRGRRLFYALHGGQDGVAWVFCNPFLEEKNDAHSVYVTLARALSSHATTVLRFDYEGEGDSEGRSDAVGLRDWVDDVADAAAWVRRECGAQRVGLFGLRLGGAIAALAASSADAAAVLLWQPIVDGESYLQECLRFNLATQVAVYKKVRYDRPALLKQLETGGSVNMRGYQVGASMALAIRGLDLRAALPNVLCPAGIVLIERAAAGRPTAAFEGLGPMVGLDLRSVKSNAFWQDAHSYDPEQRELVALSLKMSGELIGASNDKEQVV